MEDVPEIVIQPLPGNRNVEEDLVCLRNISDPRIFRFILRRRIYNYPFFLDLITRLSYLTKPEFEHLFVDNPASLTVLRILLNPEFRQFIDAVILEGGPPAAAAG